MVRRPVFTSRRRRTWRDEASWTLFFSLFPFLGGSSSRIGIDGGMESATTQDDDSPDWLGSDVFFCGARR